MKSTAFVQRRSATPSPTPRREASRSNSATTINSSNCVCGMMEKASIRQCSQAGRGTMACLVCENAPQGSQETCRSAVSQEQERRWNSSFPLPKRTREAGGTPGGRSRRSVSSSIAFTFIHLTQKSKPSRSLQRVTIAKVGNGPATSASANCQLLPTSQITNPAPIALTILGYVPRNGLCSRFRSATSP
jgi:hypothetical protein